jgi:hypothetical protein
MLAKITFSIEHCNRMSCAGQAVVQMAKSQYDGLEYAIKFFISRVAFNAELAMYDSKGDTQGSSLAQSSPKVYSLQLSRKTSDTYHLKVICVTVHNFVQATKEL